VFVLSTNQKGALAEAKIVVAAIEQGIPVLRPVQEHGRFDLALELGGRILRVQCKWGGLDSTKAGINVALQSSCLTPNGYVRTSYTPDEIDLLAVYCGGLDRCYLLPGALVCGRTHIYLRLVSPRNGQRACINLASNFEFAGAVAQWNERPAGSRKVVGSNPTSSTSPSDAGQSMVRIGSNKFRNHFGYYLERAAAGDEIHISRHGRPFARLLPAEQPQPVLEVA
jgi:prevent-host-death family protein